MTTGDAKSRLSSWFLRWRSPLHKFLRRKAGVAVSDVEDIAQEVFLRLMRYEKGELIENPQAYLFKMASNVAAEWSIRSRQRRPHEAKWLAALAATEQPEQDIIRDDAQAEIERAVGKLSIRQRRVLKLFFADGLQQAEIATQTGETPRTVRRQLARSYEKLRGELDSDLLGAMDHGRD
jgi:RNA polymerase sigma-70 factor (ECF subfamily)